MNAAVCPPIEDADRTHLTAAAHHCVCCWPVLQRAEVWDAKGLPRCHPCARDPRRTPQVPRFALRDLE